MSCVYVKEKARESEQWQPCKMDTWIHESAWKSNIATKREVVVIVYRREEFNVIFH